MQLDFNELGDYVLREFRIKLDAYKEAQMHRRIEFFVIRSGAQDTKQFISMCRADKNIRDQFVDFITINVTEFFRNIDMFLQIKDVFSRALPKKNFYAIWSSACSNGSEPYSVAMILEGMGIKNYKILATDIDENILEIAKRGVYREDEVSGVPNIYLSNYFDKVDCEYRIKKCIKDKVLFKRHDLILDEFPKKIDLILCRNVVIYFKKEEKIKIYNKFYNSLNNDGVVFIGATENIYDYKQIGFSKFGVFFYQKVVK